jgi:hypothetical protein
MIGGTGNKSALPLRSPHPDSGADVAHWSTRTLFNHSNPDTSRCFPKSLHARFIGHWNAQVWTASGDLTTYLGLLIEVKFTP